METMNVSNQFTTVVGCNASNPGTKSLFFNLLEKLVKYMFTLNVTSMYECMHHTHSQCCQRIWHYSNVHE